jgi:hypothetical protein
MSFVEFVGGLHIAAILVLAIQLIIYDEIHEDGRQGFGFQAFVWCVALVCCLGIWAGEGWPIWR